MIDKREAKRIMAEIRLVLLDVWDPIGIRDEPNAQDEYDSYVGPLSQLLINGATDDKIADWLYRQADETMGLGGVQREAMFPTVAALRKIPLPIDMDLQRDK